MNHFMNNGIEILKTKKNRNSKPKSKNVKLLNEFLSKIKNVRNNNTSNIKPKR